MEFWLEKLHHHTVRSLFHHLPISPAQQHRYLESFTLRTYGMFHDRQLMPSISKEVHGEAASPVS